MNFYIITGHGRARNVSKRQIDLGENLKKVGLCGTRGTRLIHLNSLSLDCDNNILALIYRERMNID